MRKEVCRFENNRRSDFFRLHSSLPPPDDAGQAGGWCFCVAWWVESWEGWGARTTEENRCLRETICDRGEFDGYLLYVDDSPVGWCQVGPRDRLQKLVRQFKLSPDPVAWAVTCFLLLPPQRGKGLAAFLLAEVLQDLSRRGVQRVEAFPKRGENLAPEDLWMGPEALYRAFGFETIRDDPRRPILSLSLARQE